MKTFLALNRKKVIFALKGGSLLFSLLAIILFLVGFLGYNQVMDFWLMVIVLICASVGMPFFIMCIGYLEWLSNRGTRNNAFRVSPFDKLDTIGFTYSLINEKSRWFFTEETKEILINGYRIQCDIKRSAPKIIEFNAIVRLLPNRKDAVTSIEDNFEIDKLEFGLGVITKKYDTRVSSNMPIEQVEYELVNFVAILNLAGFVPQEENI